MASNLTQIDGKWYSGCSCNSSKKEVTPPDDSKPILLQLSGRQVGPVTGQAYNIWPNEVSIDIRTADADYWIADKKTRTMLPGHKGRLTRVSS